MLSLSLTGIVLRRRGRLAHTHGDAAALSSAASLPIQPRLTVSCLTHGLGLMHMEEGRERENRNNNYPCMCVYVCISHRCMFMVHITVNHLIECVCLSSYVSVFWD